MLNARSPQVAQKLGNVLISRRARRFQFNDETVINEEVSEVFPENRSIFVQHLERMLLFHIHSSFSRPVDQRILVNLLQVPGIQVTMNRIAGLTNHITELENFVFHEGGF